ncbi:unnamed protein product [Closterium sp. NIES-54]
MALRPSSVPLRVPLPHPLESSLPAVPDPASDLAHAASPTVSRLLAIVVTDPSFESTATSALIAELVDFAAACHLDYGTSLVADSESDCPPSVGGECALGIDVFEDRQEDFECLAAALPHLVAIRGSLRCTRLHLHEEIWLCRPLGFTGSSPAALGFAPLTADPSLFLRTDTSLPSFYVLVYVNDLVFAIADTEALALVLQRFGFRYSSPQSTPLPTSHSLSAPPSDESVEPSGSYPELVGCLIHRPEHWEAAKRVLHYLCSTSGMGLVLGGRGLVVLTGHADASWVDDLATQRSSQGYTFSLGSGSVSWQSTRSSSVLSSSCEAEIYAGSIVRIPVTRPLG